LRGGFYLTDSGINARNFRSRASVNCPSDEVALLPLGRIVRHYANGDITILRCSRVASTPI